MKLTNYQIVSKSSSPRLQSMDFPVQFRPSLCHVQRQQICFLRSKCFEGILQVVTFHRFRRQPSPTSCFNQRGLIEKRTFYAYGSRMRKIADKTRDFLRSLAQCIAGQSKKNARTYVTSFACLCHVADTSRDTGVTAT